MRVLRFSLILLVVFSAVAAIAQQKTDKKSGQNKATGTQAPPSMTAKPSPEIQKYAKLVLGTWTVNESHEAGEMGPAGTSTGTATFRLGPAGVSVIEDFNSKGALGPFKGMGVIWWDPKQQAYRGMWCDSMTPICDPNGIAKWEGDKLVGTNETEMPDGSKMTMKGEYTDISANSFTYTLYTGPNAGNLKKFMTIKYTRAGAAKSKAKQ